MIHTADILLWLFIAGSVAYVLLFSIVSLPLFGRCHNMLQPSGTDEDNTSAQKFHTFLILFPAYNEDTVICRSVESFLCQQYPSDHYHVTVISDHMQPSTNDTLQRLPITLLTPTFSHSSKAKALQYAIKNTPVTYDYVVILDADNTVSPDFLYRLNHSCLNGHHAIQCHRCAKNADTDIAMLDGISEEINNTIFRKAHNRIGLSSALIGSGMCFSHTWFRDNVYSLSTAGEDRELETLLLQQGIYIKYEEDIHVRDEKVSNKDNFQRQRQRWMSAQLNSLCTMLPQIPQAIIKGNINFIDKTIQQMLIPRSILLVITPAIATVMLMVSPVWSVKWWSLFTSLCVAMFMAMPPRLRTRSVFSCLSAFSVLTLRMLNNVRKIDKSNKTFIHTTHDK